MDLANTRDNEGNWGGGGANKKVMMGIIVSMALGMGCGVWFSPVVFL